MKRRTRLLMLSAPALSALLGAQQAPSPSRNPLGATPAVLAEGQTLYNQICQTCHGPAGQGSERGAVLATATLVHGNADADVFRTIRTGVPGSQMPPFASLTDTQIWQLVAYLHSLQGSTPATGPSMPESKDTAAGEALFFGRGGCANCHEVNGRGGVVGPDLSNAGRLSAAVLQQKIVDPSAPIEPAGGRGGGRGSQSRVVVVAKQQDGREIRGVRRNEDTFSLQMIDTTGQLRLLDKTKLASVTVHSGSLHPLDDSTRLSGSEAAGAG